MTENEITGDILDASIKLQAGAVMNFGMSTLKEGFLRFVNNYPDPALCASGAKRVSNCDTVDVIRLAWSKQRLEFHSRLPQ